MISRGDNFRHPIINTFLWLFGDASTPTSTKQSKPNNISTSSGSSSVNSTINSSKTPISNSKVSWRDIKDGDDLFTIYGRNNNKIKQNPCNINNNFHSHSSNFDEDSDSIDNDNSDIDNNPHGYDDEVSESPQWGFYVSLSPNHQEIFPRVPPSKG